MLELWKVTYRGQKSINEITCGCNSPCVMTLIPAGFHLLSCHPLTHIAPRDSRGTVPSPSPNLTPERTCQIGMNGILSASFLFTCLSTLTCGMVPFVFTSVSMRCLRDSGKSRGVLQVIPDCVTFILSASGSSAVSHCEEGG